MTMNEMGPRGTPLDAQMTDLPKLMLMLLLINIGKFSWRHKWHTGRIQCELLTALRILSSWIKKFLDNNQKSEMTARWRNYSSNLQKIFNIVGPRT